MVNFIDNIVKMINDQNLLVCGTNLLFYLKYLYQTIIWNNAKIFFINDWNIVL